MGLAEKLAPIVATAAEHAQAGESLTGVVPAEPAGGTRVYLCSYEQDERRSWLALDETGAPIADAGLVAEAASIAALCEVAEDSAGGGDLAELRSQLLTLRLTEAPIGIEEAEAAALALEQVIAAPPRVASVAYLDAVGAAVRRLEQTLGNTTDSPFAAAMQQAVGVADELVADVAAHYKLELR